MAQVQTKWIADDAITGAKISAQGKQAVLESKLVGARRGVLAFATTAASSDTVTTEVEAAAVNDAPQTDLTTAEGIFTGTVANATDFKKVLIRQAGTDQGIDDGNGDEVFGKLSEAGGVFTLSYFKADNTAFTFGSVTNIDFYFVEVQDLHTLNAEALLSQSVSGVIDAGQAATLSGHLDGGANKHDASEIDVETAGNFTTVADLETNLGAIDGAFGGDLSFVPTNYADPADNVQAHLQAIDTALGTALGSDFADNAFRISDDGDATKKIAFEASGITTGTVRTITMPDADVNLGDFNAHLDGTANKHDATEIDVETAGNFTTVADLETNLGAIDGAFGGDLSFVPSNYADPADNVQAHLQAIDTALGTALATDFTDDVFRISDDGDNTKKIAFQASGISTSQTRTITMPDADVDLGQLNDHLDGTANKHDATEVDVETAGNFTTVADLETNLAAIDGAFGGDLSFVPTNYADPADNVQAHLQAIDTALGAVSSQTSTCESFTLTGTDITNKYVDLASVPDAEACVQVHPIGGPLQNYSVDFDIITDGSEEKRLSWNALGMDGILSSGDIIKVYYQVA